MISETNQQIRELGGKAFHLKVLERGGFEIPPTFLSTEAANLPDGNYVVRSSEGMEDSLTKTCAGKNRTLKGIVNGEISNAISVVKTYVDGDVVIQPDLTDDMDYSGVVYTNLNGEFVIRMGKHNSVHGIVEGKEAETEINILGTNYGVICGVPINPLLISTIKNEGLSIEDYFGIPFDLEFAIVDGRFKFLQARPLPNLTDRALKEHEVRQLRKVIILEGLEEIVLGVGNYREILGDTFATCLSTTTFNYIFSGDGETTLGAVQLGRNELGYDLGTEIFPWVVFVGGKVYYNFAGDALQFRPMGIDKKDLIDIINQVYIPMARADPDLLNYPELRLYVQFPSQAEQVGLNPLPYKILAEKNRQAIKGLAVPKEPPIKRNAKHFIDPEECLGEINKTIDEIRTGSAREYVKAARLAFFAMEDVRMYLEELKTRDTHTFREISDSYSIEETGSLRDSLVYDESIPSFEVPEVEEYSYLGSFELTLPRGFPPRRHLKNGRIILDHSLSTLVEETREVLGYREKVKFFLFREYDYLKQLFEQFGKLTGFEESIYDLNVSELPLTFREPVLALYRIELRKRIKGRELFEDPIFGSELERGVSIRYETRPHLIFGSLHRESLDIRIGTNGYIVNSVDQTTGIPSGTDVVFVPDNVRPGSHLFTVLSDYGIPVIAVSQKYLNSFKERPIRINPLKDGEINIETL